MARLHDASIEVDGERVVFTEEGSGPPVVLIHGAVTNRHLWDPMVERLRDRYRVLAPDLTGYGDSSHPRHRHLGLDAQARHVEQFLRAVDAVPCALVGHGVGGGIAQDLAARHPDRVTALVLVASVTGTTWPSRDLQALQQTHSPGGMAASKLMGTLESHLLSGIHDPARVPAGWQEPFLAPWRGDEGRAAAWHAILDLDSRDTLDIEDRLAGLPVPVTLVWGAMDAVYPVTRAAHLREIFPDAPLQVLPGVGHYPPLEDPDATAEEVDRAVTAALAQAQALAPGGKTPLP